MHDFTDHLASLERRLRRTQWLAASSLIALLGFVSLAAMQKGDDNLQATSLTAGSISTNSFTLRDDQGRPRVSILNGKDGGPFVSLLDADSKVRLLLMLQEDEHPLVQFSNADESPQINLFYNKNLGSGLVMLGDAGQALYAVPNGAPPLVEFRDGDGEPTYSAP